VTLADDPAADLQAAHGRFLYFAPDEVEPDQSQPDTGQPDQSQPDTGQSGAEAGAHP
jgi:hypothetical protein